MGLGPRWLVHGPESKQSPNSGDDSEWHGEYEDSDRPKRKGGKGGKGGAKGGKGGSAGGAGGAGKGKAKGRGGGGNYWRGNWFQDVHFYRSSQLPVPICPCSTNFQSSQVGTSTDDSFWIFWNHVWCTTKSWNVLSSVDNVDMWLNPLHK